MRTHRAFLIPLSLLPLPLAAQAVAPPVAAVLRIEAGTLAPEDPLTITLAFGGAAGLELGRRHAILLGYTRQSNDRNQGDDIGARARRLVSLSWEYTLRRGSRYRQELRLRTGLGLLKRPSLRTAPVATAGLAIRYGVAPNMAFVGLLQDHMAALPREPFQVCGASQALGPGNVLVPAARCTSYVAGGFFQHNFGAFIALEWRP